MLKSDPRLRARSAQLAAMAAEYAELHDQAARLNARVDALLDDGQQDAAERVERDDLDIVLAEFDLTEATLQGAMRAMDVPALLIGDRLFVNLQAPSARIPDRPQRILILELEPETPQ